MELKKAKEIIKCIPHSNLYGSYSFTYKERRVSFSYITNEYGTMIRVPRNLISGENSLLEKIEEILPFREMFHIFFPELSWGLRDLQLDIWLGGTKEYPHDKHIFIKSTYSNIEWEDHTISESFDE